jgi:hypothetical protein
MTGRLGSQRNCCIRSTREPNNLGRAAGAPRRPASAKATAARRSFSEGGSGAGHGAPALRQAQGVLSSSKHASARLRGRGRSCGATDSGEVSPQPWRRRNGVGESEGRSPSDNDERGAILLHVLMFTTLVTAVAAGVAILARIETMVSAHFRERHELAAAAVAGAEIALQDLRSSADWSEALSGTRTAAFTKGSSSASLPVGMSPQVICCGAASLTGQLQAESGVTWTPFGWSTLADLTGTAFPTPIFLVVWVADDSGDADGDPARDGNGTIRVHVQALAYPGGRRSVSLTATRSAPSLFPAILLWRER